MRTNNNITQSKNSHMLKPSIYIRRRPKAGQRRWIRATGSQWSVPGFKKSIQSLGNGSTQRWIEVETQTIAQANENFFRIGNLIDTTEFRYFMSSYKYVKLDKIILAIYPTDTAINYKVGMEWEEDAIASQSYITNEDSTKQITTKMFRYQFLRFKPPNLNIQVKQNTDTFYFNYREWIPTAAFVALVPNLPTTIRIEKPLSAASGLKISYHLLLRGGRIPIPSQLKSVIEKQNEERKNRPQKITKEIKGPTDNLE